METQVYGNGLVSPNLSSLTRFFRVQVDSPLFDCSIHVDGSDLGIAVAPISIHRPFVSSSFTRERMSMMINPFIMKLELKVEGQLEWILEFIRSE